MWWIIYLLNCWLLTLLVFHKIFIPVRNFVSDEQYEVTDFGTTPVKFVFWTWMAIAPFGGSIAFALKILFTGVKGMRAHFLKELIK